MNYTEENNKLVISLKATTYKEGLKWVNIAANLAEEVNHHPDIVFGYSKIEITLSTHDDGNVVTKKDHDFAKEFLKRIEK